MLVFRRQQGESFRVGEAVEVRILKIGRGQVKIGVVAPREVAIYRTEISRLNQGAALADPARPGVRKAIAALQKLWRSRDDA